MSSPLDYLLEVPGLGGLPIGGVSGPAVLREPDVRAVEEIFKRLVIDALRKADGRWFLRVEAARSREDRRRGAREALMRFFWEP